MSGTYGQWKEMAQNRIATAIMHSHPLHGDVRIQTRSATHRNRVLRRYGCGHQCGLMSLPSTRQAKLGSLRPMLGTTCQQRRQAGFRQCSSVLSGSGSRSCSSRARVRVDSSQRPSPWLLAGAETPRGWREADGAIRCPLFDQTIDNTEAPLGTFRHSDCDCPVQRNYG